MSWYLRKPGHVLALLNEVMEATLFNGAGSGMLMVLTRELPGDQEYSARRTGSASAGNLDCNATTMGARCHRLPGALLWQFSSCRSRRWRPIR